MAAVTEAAHRSTCVAAHADSPEAIAMAVHPGVHSIEHGNLVVSNVNPLDDLAAFADTDRSIPQVIQGGNVVLDQMS